MTTADDDMRDRAMRRPAPDTARLAALLEAAGMAEARSAQFRKMAASATRSDEVACSRTAELVLQILADQLREMVSKEQSNG